MKLEEEEEEIENNENNENEFSFETKKIKFFNLTIFETGGYLGNTIKFCGSTRNHFPPFILLLGPDWKSVLFTLSLIIVINAIMAFVPYLFIILDQIVVIYFLILLDFALL